MAANAKQIIYFHSRLDATATAIRAKRSDIDMARHFFDAPAAETWAAMGRAHGYHACARTEMRAPWFPDAELFARAPNLLAVCSLGAGYDVIDVEACTKAGILVCNQSGANREAVAEHAVGLMPSDEVVNSYKRTDLLEKRRPLMEQWAKHCGLRAQPTKPAKAKETAAEARSVTAG